MENDMKELLNKIGITEAGHFEKDGSYVIDFETDEQYNKAFSRLDRSNLLEENPDGGTVSLSASVIVYEADEFMLQLVSNFDKDEYKLIVKEVED